MPKEQLDQIEHIVVLMLENRSFDHMLGYLSLPPAQGGKGRTDVDGLTGAESNLDRNGVEFPVARMNSPIMNGDPCHEWPCVEEQLSMNNGGFLQNYANVVVSNPEFIMHYFTGADVPVYDHLAGDFTICDRWFCSLPGPTQPNRAYSLAGTADGLKRNLKPQELLLGKGFEGRTIFEMLPDNVSWKIYSHDIASLRFFKKFRAAIVPQIDKIPKFFNDAKAGHLPNLTWIDPDFGITVFPGPPNDDHPPHDSRHCQNLVSNVYNALLESPNWSKTLLIVTYDEHGGFFDHVLPGSFQPNDDDRNEFKVYGVRIPTFIVSPWAGKQQCFGRNTHGVSTNELIFDHTSTLKTILNRFGTKSGVVPSKRIAAANDVSVLLTESTARTDCKPAPFIPNVPVAFKDNFMLEADRNELQESLDAMVAQASANGVPPDNL